MAKEQLLQIWANIQVYINIDTWFISTYIYNNELSSFISYSYYIISISIGSWVKGSKHGKGTLIWWDGSQYTGDWQKDRLEGIGTFNGADGSVYTGKSQCTPMFCLYLYWDHIYIYFSFDDYSLDPYTIDRYIR